MRPHHHIHPALGQRLQHLGLLPRRPEPAQLLHRDRPVGKPIAQGSGMLLGQNRGRGQHHHLLSRHHGLEGGPDGHLRLTVPHIPADQPVHRPGSFHVRLHFRKSSCLVHGRFIGELGLELPLPLMVGRKRKSRHRLPLSRRPQKGGCEVLHRLFRLGLGPFPATTTQSV